MIEEKLSNDFVLWIYRIKHMNISNHISYEEAIKTSSKLDNTPNPIQLGCMKLVANKCFEPLREYFDKPIGISSFFRSVKVNYEMGGAKTSQHTKGEAIDIDADIYGGLTNKEIFDWLKDNVEYDQLVWEFGTNDNPSWVHVSYSSTGNRKQILKAIINKNKTEYQTYESKRLNI